MAHFVRQGDLSPLPPSEDSITSLSRWRTAHVGGLRGLSPSIKNHHVHLGFDLFHQIFVFRLKFRLEPFKVLLF